MTKDQRKPTGKRTLHHNFLLVKFLIAKTQPQLVDTSGSRVFSPLMWSIFCLCVRYVHHYKKRQIFHSMFQKCNKNRNMDYPQTKMTKGSAILVGRSASKCFSPFHVARQPSVAATCLACLALFYLIFIDI